MRRRRFVCRRDAHQTLDRQFQGLTAQRDKRRRLAWPDAGLLRLFTGVYLDEQGRMAPATVELRPQHMREFRPIQRMDCVEQLHGLTYLVRLERPDQMQRATGVFGFQSRPFGPGLLNAILSEYRLTGGEDGAASISKVLETATSVVKGPGEWAAFLAAATRARISLSAWTEADSCGSG